MDSDQNKADVIAWTEWDRAENERYDEMKIPRSKTVVLKLKVLQGHDIKRDSILNLVDIPNPQIKLEFPIAKGVAEFRTTAKINTAEPIWNESFAFILPPDYGTNERFNYENVKFTLIVEDWYTRHDPIAHAEFNPSRLNFDEEVEEIISFGRHGSIVVKIVKSFVDKPNLRLSLCLSDEEIKFRANRMPKVMKGLHKMLGCEDAPKSLFETPVMSLLGSGGGLRAVVGMCGVMEALSETGLLDCLTYAIGTSGSSWYISGAYARRALQGNRRRQYHAWLRKSFHTASIWEMLKLSNIKRWKKQIHEKRKNGQPLSLVDYYGICVANKVTGKKFASGKLSDLRSYVRTAEVPYPILNTVQVQDTLDVWKYHADCNLSPFECELPNYGINVDTTLLNSEFYDGILTRRLPEPTLSFTLGALGSVFALRLSKLLGLEKYEHTNIHETTTNAMYFAEKKESNNSFGAAILMWLSNLPHFLDRNVLITRSAQLLNVVRGITNLTRFALNPGTDHATEDHSTNDDCNGISQTDEVMSLIDGGILCNVAIGAALRPQRRNDILFVCDFTGYGDVVTHETLESALKLAKAGKFKFPYVDLEKIKREETRELYIFEDENDADCPIVFWFMPSTDKFRKERNYVPRNKKILKQLEHGQTFTDFHVFGSEEYATIETEYTDVDFERLRELMRYIVKLHAEEIKARIKQRIATKRKLRKQ